MIYRLSQPMMLSFLRLMILRHTKFELLFMMAILLTIQNVQKRYTEQQYFRSEEEMCDLFADIPSALENTVLIAQRCNVTLRLGQYFLPQFPTGELSTEDYLVMKAKEGLEERLAFYSLMKKCGQKDDQSMMSVFKSNWM